MQTTYSNTQLEQLSLMLAAASRMAGASLPFAMTGASLPFAMPGMAYNAAHFVGSSSTLPFSTEEVKSSFLPPVGKIDSKFPEPDVKTFTYDPTVGYRFDPSTGLHYDANSCLFINMKLGVLLRYDKLTSTYERAGSIADICAPVLAKEFAELMGYDTSRANTQKASPNIKTPPPPSPLPPVTRPASLPPVALQPPSLSPNRSSRFWPADKIQASYADVSPCTDSPFLQGEPSRRPKKGREYSSKYSPSPLSDSDRIQSPDRGRSTLGRDHYSSAGGSFNLICNPIASTRGRGGGKGGKRGQIPGKPTMPAAGSASNLPQKSKTIKKNPFCAYCKRRGHTKTECFRANKMCFKCGLSDKHFAADCPAPTSSQPKEA